MKQFTLESVNMTFGNRIFADLVNLRWTLNPIWLASLEEEDNMDTEEKWTCGDIGRDYIYTTTSQKTPKIAGNHWKIEGAWENSSLEL